MLVRPAIIWGYILVANQRAELLKLLFQISLCKSDRSHASFPSFYPSLVFLFRFCCLHLCFILRLLYRQLSCLANISQFFFPDGSTFLTDNFHLSQCVFKLICIMLCKPVPCLAELPWFQLFSQLCSYSIIQSFDINISWHIAMYKKLS